ncbi:hypothetical protein DBV05_g9625 [Lasiodiplodia theobromae]|uniref:Uncharacterized protein n=1 Tax=Lasiodiplodia theobromae TaxID=45133 RepID=A0A5N5D201_9PEZI|nr:hypothetical protein DBV05_g9625 [Lasiodiplodia theobromae]
MMRLAVSRSKADFLQSLGLSNDNPADRQVYIAIKREAMEGRARLCQNRDNLMPQCRDDVTVQPPFSSSQMMETAMHREVLRIYSLASPTTRPYYQLGRFMDGENVDNWVIRWMLWNTFRYGMNRKRHPGNCPPPPPPSPATPPPPPARLLNADHADSSDDLLNSPEGSPTLNTVSPVVSQAPPAGTDGRTVRPS